MILETPGHIPLLRVTPVAIALTAVLGLPTMASSQGEFPAVPCDNPLAAPADRGVSTCACENVEPGVCPYDTGDSCLEDQLICRPDVCAEVLVGGNHPVDRRCSAVGVDRLDLPNLVILLSDDANWPSYEDVDDPRTGRPYSLYSQFFQNLVCHGGPTPGATCSKRGDCFGSPCEVWTHRCAGGSLDGQPCRADRDCVDAGSVCQRCLPGECSTNPIRTPNLRRLAESGAFFPMAHTTASVCAPSILSMLSGRYPKDLKPAKPPVVTPSISRLLSDTHCSVSVGKTWLSKWDNSDACYDCCCEAAGCCDDPSTCPVTCSPERCCGDPKTGFHYSVQRDFRTPFARIGRRRRSMDRGACLLREINLEGRAFFAWMLAYVPHAPGRAPAALTACYDDVQKTSRLLVDDRNHRLPVGDYLGRISWFDCILGSFLRFLETTPDTRFCPHPSGHSRAAHTCGACARECSDSSPCGGGVACVNGRCDTDVPCLIDTTVLLYVNDNGKGIGRAKASFFENGYRNPIILSYGELGAVDRQGLATLPPPVERRIQADRLASTLDFLPTALHYAGCGGEDCSATCSPACERCGLCERTSCPGGVCGRHLGRSLRQLVEDPATPWRRFLFGHAAGSNSRVAGKNPHYLRTGKFIANGVPTTSGSGGCQANADCTAQGWAFPPFDLTQCVNGVCTRPCEVETDCTIPPLGTSAGCVNGFCMTGSECKLYHEPRSCTQKLFNLTQDPTERTSLLDPGRRPRPDRLRACFDPAGGPGREFYEEMSCELVRWCLEGCTSGSGISCSDCCALDLCQACSEVVCGPCLGSGACVEVAPGRCVSCAPGT